MKETLRISRMFDALYNGQPWIDVTILGTLNNLTAAQAARRIAPGRNSTWELVVHMIRWRQNVLERLEGKVIPTPSNNYFEPVADTSEAAWKSTLLQLAETQEQWIGSLAKMDEAELEKRYSNSGLTYYELIHGILQHDAYHLGQIALLAKLV